jgi:hypothetical protein
MWINNLFKRRESKRPPPASTSTPPRGSSASEFLTPTQESSTKKRDTKTTPKRKVLYNPSAPADPLPEVGAKDAFIPIPSAPLNSLSDPLMPPSPVRISNTAEDLRMPPITEVGSNSAGLRSMAEVHKLRDKLTPAAGLCRLPIGPYETEEGIVAAVTAWARHSASHGGAFGIPPKQESLKKATKQRGPRRLLLCDRSGHPRITKLSGVRPNQQTRKCNCPWGVWIEQCKEGWTTAEMPKKAREILNAQAEPDIGAALHNHPLLETVAEINTNASLRGIPADLAKRGEILSQAGLEPLKIFHALCDECHNQGIDILFTRKDVYNKYAEQSLEKSLDCSNLIEYLTERQSNDSQLSFEFHLNENGVLDQVFLVQTKP